MREPAHRCHTCHSGENFTPDRTPDPEMHADWSEPSALAHIEAVIWFLAVIAIGLFVGAYNMGANNVRVMTDRSGSLVLSGVHPDFARTVEAQSTSGVN